MKEASVVKDCLPDPPTPTSNILPPGVLKTLQICNKSGNYTLFKNKQTIDCKLCIKTHFEVLFMVQRPTDTFLMAHLASVSVAIFEFFESVDEEETMDRKGSTYAHQTYDNYYTLFIYLLLHVIA